jgi:hypothetical protein
VRAAAPTPEGARPAPCRAVLTSPALPAAALLNDRTLFLRERAAKVYGTLSYLISKVAAGEACACDEAVGVASDRVADLLPMRVIPSLLFAVLTYSMVGLRHSLEAFLYYCLLIVLINFVVRVRPLGAER